VTSRWLAGVMTVAIMGSLGAAHGRAADPSRVTASSTSGRILLRGVLTPRVVSTSAGLYVAWQVSRLGSSPISELARVNSTTGRIEANRRLGAAFDQAVAVDGSLYVGVSTPSSVPGEALLRLNARTLAVTRRWSDLGEGGSLAVAGGGLWVAGGNRLLRLSLPEGNVIASVALPGADRSDVASNTAGTILVVGEADEGRGALERRDPETGTLLASSSPMIGVTAPALAEVTGQGVWVSEATGMTGYVERFDAATLTPEPGTGTEGSNAISASVADGILWVSQMDGGSTTNFCGNPSDGAARAPLNLPPSALLQAIGPHDIYYVTPTTSAGAELLHSDVHEETIPAACRVG
jgi:hypothetical protein